MNPILSRDVRITRRVRRFLVVLLASSATALVSGSGPVEAQQAGGLLKPPGGASAGESTVRALVLDQVKRVPVGSGKKLEMAETRQFLVAALDGTKLYMAEYERDGRLKQHIQVLLDGDASRIYTITPDGRHYREHSGDLNDLQEERNIAEWNLIKLAEDTMSAREREEFFRRNPHLRPDGTREVKVSLKKGKRLLGRDCEHLTVEENGLTIIDAEVTTAIPGSRNYYHLYRRLGAFSEEVLERLKDVDGVPLEARINVVTALKRWPLEVETQRMDIRQVPAAFFELPPGAERIVEQTGIGKCPKCGKEFEQESGVLHVDNANRKIWLCSEPCAEKYAVEELKKGSRLRSKSSPRSPSRSE